MRTVKNFRARWRGLRPFLGPPRQVTLLCASAVASGLSEAGLLAAVVQAGLAIAAGERRAEIDIGPLSLSTPVGVLLAVAGGLAATRLILAVAQASLASRMSSGVLADVRRRTFGDFLGATWAIQAQEREGHLQELMTTHAGRAANASLEGAIGIVAIADFTILLISALVIDPISAGTILLSVIGLFFLLRPIARRGRRYTDLQRKSNQSYAGRVTESVSIALEVRIFDVGDPVRESMDRAADETSNDYRRSKFLNRLVPGLYQNVSIGFLVLGLAVVYLMSTRQLASLGAVILMLVRSLTYGQVAQSAYHHAQEYAPYLRQIAEQQQRYRAARVIRSGAPLERIERLGFDHVSFAYVPSNPVLTDVSFEACRGESVGVIGPSGSGKSTLVQLLLRLRQPDEGRFLVNGEDASRFDLSDFYQRVAFVPQEPRLFAGTLADNIRFFRYDIDDAAIRQAAGQAQLSDEIQAWPLGYETPVGPRGSALSGGQRQRVALARALVRRPDVLVLDEPTSSLDLPSEKQIQETLADLRTTVTLFVVAHRLSTLSLCDRIMVFGPGGLNDFGTRETLEASSPFYQQALALTRAE